MEMEEKLLQRPQGSKTVNIIRETFQEIICQPLLREGRMVLKYQFHHSLDLLRAKAGIRKSQNTKLWEQARA